MNEIRINDRTGNQIWDSRLESVNLSLGEMQVRVMRENNHLKLLFPDISEIAIHLPTHSGIRIDHTFDRKWLPLPGHYACSIGVIEYKGMFFTLFDSEGKTDIELFSFGDGWEWVWQTESNVSFIWSHERSLADCVDLYRKYRPIDIINQEITAPIKRIITLDMMLANGDIAHTYDDVIHLINDLASVRLASGTLIYLPGWCGPYDKNYPIYHPNEQLGGEIGFLQMVERANQENVILMPHMNYWGYDPSLQLFTEEQLVEMQLQDERGEPAGWSGPTNSFAYMRPDHPEWQKLLLAQITSFLERYAIKAIMLDQIGVVIKDKRCDFLKGTNEILHQIRIQNPQIIISGEMLNDQIISQVNLIQLWGMPWCGIDVDLTTYTSRITKLLFPHVSFYGHLGLPSSLNGPYTWTNHEYLISKGTEAAFYEAQQHLSFMGGIPHVRLQYRTNGLDALSLRYLSK